MASVFITREVPGRATALLEAAGHEAVVWPGDLPPSPDELRSALATAEAALTMVTDRLDGEMFAACPRLRVASNMAVGFDNFDVAAATEAGVWLTNTPGVLAETTADFAFALLMSAARNVSLSERDTRDGNWLTWSPTAFLGHDIHGATLGIVGLGEIGLAMAARARGFGMRILYTSRTRKHQLEGEKGLTWLPFDRVLAEADFLSLHVPLTPETRHLIGAPELAKMKPSAILVNTSRGGVVDQAALIAALRERRIWGAAVDVADPEPVRPGDPLLELPNLLLTPHIASASFRTRARMAEMAAENIIAVLSGAEPPNPLNRPPGPRTT